MAAAKRIGLSKKARFEVFKRDGFQCAYCGAHPPSVVLHVDHIKPVAAGGKNSEDNLITACQACNQGKGATSLDSVPESLAVKAERVKEAELQLAGYTAVMEAKRTRIERESQYIYDTIYPTHTRRDLRDLMSIKTFIAQLSFPTVLEAADIAIAKPISRGSVFRYFCGVCWSMLKEQKEKAL